jgi:ankyrin repeat protein
VLPDEKRLVVVPLLDPKKTYLRDYDAEFERSLKYPLHKAVREGNIKDVWNFLLKGTNLLSYNHIGMQPLHYVSYLSDEESAVQIATALYNFFQVHKQSSIDFLNVMRRGNASEILEARESGAHEVLRFFISNFQPFPSIDDMADYYELMPEVEGDHDPLEVEKIKAKNLLNQLQSMNLMAIPTRSCIMPLTLAIEAKKFDLAKKLIELGAPVNVDSESSQLPLVLAVESRNLDLINLLLKAGAISRHPETLEYLNSIQDSSTEVRQYVRTIKVKHSMLKELSNRIKIIDND